MKNKRFPALISAVILLLAVSACSKGPAPAAAPSPSPLSSPIPTSSPLPPPSPSQAPGQIYLYGEAHGVKTILDKEFELWREYYDKENMRHLFIEYPYYTAEFLNIWMRADGDDILNEIYNDWAGTQAQNPSIKEFYQKIKSACPETIYHGTDVGHSYYTTGERYLKYLKDNNLKASGQYSLAQEAIEQGKYFIVHSDHAYRENKMAENFIREFDSLNGENIMGIYGAAHTGLDAMDFSGAVPCMANQLKAYYGEIVHSEDLTWMAKDIDPSRVDIINIGGKDYEASYFGKRDISAWSKEFASREFWHLGGAYDDLKNNPKTGNILPYDNYPMPIEEGQVFVIDYTKTDGSVVREYHLSDGYASKYGPSTEEFSLK